MKEGVAVVSYSCKGLKVLKDCKVDGKYGFLGMTKKEQVIRLNNADEVKANLPLAGAGIAANIGAEMQRGATLDVAMVMIGKIKTTNASLTKDDLQGECADATHFVKGAIVGAFVMETGTKGSAKTAAQLFGAGASGGVGEHEERAEQGRRHRRLREGGSRFAEGAAAVSRDGASRVEGARAAAEDRGREARRGAGRDAALDSAAGRDRGRDEDRGAAAGDRVPEGHGARSGQVHVADEGGAAVPLQRQGREAVHRAMREGSCRQLRDRRHPARARHLRCEAGRQRGAEVFCRRAATAPTRTAASTSASCSSAGAAERRIPRRRRRSGRRAARTPMRARATRSAISMRAATGHRVDVTAPRSNSAVKAGMSASTRLFAFAAARSSAATWCADEREERSSVPQTTSTTASALWRGAPQGVTDLPGPLRFLRTPNSLSEVVYLTTAQVTRSNNDGEQAPRRRAVYTGGAMIASAIAGAEAARLLQDPCLRRTT